MLHGIGGRAEHLLLTTDGAGHHAGFMHLHVLLQHVLDVLPVATGVVKHLTRLVMTRSTTEVPIDLQKHEI